MIIHLGGDVNPNLARIEVGASNQATLHVDLSQICADGTIEGEDRPLNLIDGQHRVRGSARSQMGDILQIPFILIPSTYGPDNAARLFTEINTTSKELDKDHQLFLAHRFMISHHDRSLSMGAFIPGENNFHDRANRLSYEMAARLSNTDNPLESQVQMLKSNGTTNCIEITKWLQFSKQWFLPGGPYDLDSDRNEDYMEQELVNYFSADHNHRRIMGIDWTAWLEQSFNFPV